MLPYLIAGAIGFVVGKLLEEDEAPKYADGGLIAPNGKPSNLTPIQYKLVRTPAFKQWFGDWENNPSKASKVVDENGEPLHLYHYSNKNFNFFKTFSFFAEIKNSYRTNLLKNEYNVYLSIQNPLELRYNKLGKNKFFKVVKEIYEGVIFKKGRYKGQGFDEESIEFMMSNANEIKDSKGFYKLLSDFIGGYNWDWVVDYAKKKGFDGVFFNETNRDLTETFTGFLAFEPNQIKIADGTNNTFDSSNPDIRFMAGGDTKKIKNEEYIVFREEYFKHLIAGELGNIKSFSEKNGNKNINDLAIKLSLLHQQHKAYLQGSDIINELYLLAKKIDENTGLKTSKGITYNSIIKRDIFFLKETHDKIDEEAIPIFNEKNPDIRFDEGGYINNFKYSLTFGGITIYTNIEQEYVGKNYSPFESKGSFKADIRKSDLDNIAIESEQLKDFNFQWGVDNWKSISQKLKNKGINKLELYIGGITKNYELKVLSDSENTDIRYAGGGSVLLAPNGKPSNLTPEQYKLVRTPEFKAWFGDWENSPETASRVVDENGEPLVCYHYSRSPKEFLIFDKKHHPKIANFVENKYHKHLGYDFSTKEGFFKSKNSIEYKVFLNVRKIFNTKIANEKQFEPLIKILSSIPFYSHYEYRKLDLERDIEELKKGEWDVLELPSIEKYLSKKYDGLIMYERDWLNIKVYDNKNIKLADGINTTFDSNNPDIRFEEGGKVDLSEYNRALKEVYPLIPQISHKIIHENNLPHNKETIIKLNEEIIEKVKRGDDKTLDLMWDIAWSLSLKHSINVITYYHKKYKNGGL